MSSNLTGILVLGKIVGDRQVYDRRVILRSERMLDSPPNTLAPLGKGSGFVYCQVHMDMYVRMKNHSEHVYGEQER